MVNLEGVLCGERKVWMEISRRTRQASLWWLVLVLLLFLAAGAYLLITYLPNWQMVEVRDKKQLIIGEEIKTVPSFHAEDGQIWLPYSVVHEYLDPHLFWDKERDLVIMSTEDKVIRMTTDALTAKVNREPFDLNVPVIKVEGEPYIPADLLMKLYPVKIEQVGENRVIMDLLEQPKIKATVTREKGGTLRISPDIKAPIVGIEDVGSELVIFGERDNWFKVRTSSGDFGYIHESEVKLTGIVSKARQEEIRIVRGRQPGEKINLTWEYVGRVGQARPDFASLTGVNVISPTWFTLADDTGFIESRADLGWVREAHEHGIQVWALVENGFDPDRTKTVLRDSEKREYVIDQLLVFAAMYELDGINIDFENVYYEDRDYLTQFVREFTPLAHEQGLVVSIDVTIKSSSPNWSMVYDRKAYAEIVDYVALMTYDEHWASSPKAGSVASLPWVERGLQGVLEEVPAEKLLLGVPFYTRIWQEETTANGQVKVSSIAVGMGYLQRWLEERNLEPIWDEKTGQYYAEYTEENIRYRVWIEEETSMAARVDLVRKYGLAGVASWRRGFEKPVIWDVIDERLRMGPM